ncbi:MAG: STAS domain-containing protein [Bacteroidales bacterium]
MKDIKFKMNQPQKGENFVRIYLGGDLSVNTLGEILPKLKAVEKDYSELEINVNDVTVFDLSSIQLLVSLQKSAEKHKKKIKFKIDLPKDVMELIENSGFMKIVKKL